MKRYFRFSISSFVSVVILTVLAVILTANVHTDEKTNMGKIVSDSQSSIVYIEPANISVSINPGTTRFFADTKNRWVSEYLKSIGAVFGAECDDEGREIYVAVDAFPAYGTVAEAYEDIINKKYNEGLLFFEGENKEINGVNYFNGKYAFYNTSDRIYELHSDYVMVTDEKYQAVSLSDYISREPSLVDVESYVEQPLGFIIDSISVGDMTKGKKTGGDGLIDKVLSYNFSLWVLLIPVLYIVICNVEVAVESGEWQPDIMGRDRSKNILGIFAVLIVIHHLVQYIGVQNAGILRFMENCGVLFVGVYFFYSGYGLFYSFKNKKDYLKGFFRKRLSAVLIPFYVCILIFVAVSLIKGEQDLSFDIVLQLTGVLLINDHMWYIVEISLLYILFYVLFRFIKNEKLALALMTGCVVLMIVASLLLGHGNYWFQGEWWYNTSFLFVIGILVARNKDRFIAFCKKHYSKILVILVPSFLLLFKANEYMLENYGYWTEYTREYGYQSICDKAMTLGVQLTTVIIFSFIIILVGMKIRCNNSVLSFLGSISLELYLIHNLFIKSFTMVTGAGIFFVIVIASSIITALVLYNVDTCVGCLINKKPIPKRKSIVPIVKELLNDWKTITRTKLNEIIHNPKRFIVVWIREIICLAITVITVAPIYLLAVNATKKKIVGEPLLIPGKSFVDNVMDINQSFSGPGGSVVLGIINSCFIAVTVALVSTYIAALTAYAFERYNFRFKKQLWWIMIGCLMIPQAVAYVGVFKNAARMGLLNNLLFVSALAFANPAAVYFIRMYLKNLGVVSLGEAARIDGASEIKIFNRIMLPVMRPVLALQLTFSFVAAWNNGLAQSIFIYDWDKKTIASYVKLIAGGNAGALDPFSYALALVATLPPLVVYILCSKSIISSITLGAVKE